MDIPSRVEDGGTHYPSVQYQLSGGTPGIQPFVTSINMNGLNGTNDCIGYINKLATLATNSPGNTIMSASANRYANTNYYFDDTRDPSYENSPLGLSASNAVVEAGVSTAAVTYTNAANDLTLSGHIATGINVAGYMSWGVHGNNNSTNSAYPINGSIVFSGNSGWWLIETIESYNGQAVQASAQGNFIEWFSSNAFGGTNYSNTPVGAVSNVEEPGTPTSNYTAIYFGLWGSGKNAAICAWNARNTTYFQAVGDPLVTR